jgi:hypothetical protein
LVEDPKWELAILATVQGFYEKLLQEALDGEVPVPSGLEAISLQQSDGDVHLTLSMMRRWLRLLDLAITPGMLRRAFTPDTDPEIAEAMLRYLVRHKDANAINRAKTDLVVTFLYRHPRVPGQWERRGFGLDGSLPLSPFEIALIEILADSDVPSLPEEHVQLLRRFDPLKEETEKFPDFKSLMDSGTITQLRELKHSLNTSFYHPGVLATIAPFNAAFGKKFEELFRAAATDIKNYAEILEEQGGSILGNVDGVDVTTEHVAAMDQEELLNADYDGALERFQRVSKLKKAMDRRPPLRRIQRTVLPSSPATPAKPTAATETVVLPLRKTVNFHVTPQQLSIEESKLRRVEESIRVFVRVADPKFRQVVPMHFFNLTLTVAEVDAYCADFLQEKSARAEIARILMRILALVARMSTELGELKRSENSPSLWKLHADSLVVLLELGRTVTEMAGRAITAVKENGGMEDQVEGVNAALQKLRKRSQTATAVLDEAETEKQVL